MELNNLSSNWKRLQQTLKSNSSSSAAKRKPPKDTAGHGPVKRRRTALSSPSSAVPSQKRPAEFERKSTHKRRKMWATPKEVAEEVSQGKHGTMASTTVHTTTSAISNTGKVNEGLSSTAEVGKYIAIDCEMVGVGPNPDQDSALARVSIVNFNGDQVYDSFVRPKEMVTDWRTHVSGISAKHMTNARSFEEVQRDVANLLDGCILVGHAVRNDLDALLLGHPKRDIRDTSKYPPYKKLAGGGSPRLKILASELLGLEIQTGAHSSVEDARATMLLFRRDKDGFEREHAKKWPLRVQSNGEKKDGEGNGNGKKKKHKKKKGRK